MRRIAVPVVLLLALIAAGSQGISLWASEADAQRMSTEAVDRPGGVTERASSAPRYYMEDRAHPERAGVAFPAIEIVPHEGPLKPRRVTEKDFYLNIVDVSNHARMVIKFTEESLVRWADGKPYSRSKADVSPVLAFLERHPDIEMHRQTVQLPEEHFDFLESNGERNTGQDLANLNNFYVLEIPSNPDPMGLILEVINIDIVETAFYEPQVQVACTDIAPVTPNWVANQDYLEAAPLGVDAVFAGNYHPSGRGNPGSWCIDIEWNWTENHEDFPVTFSVLGGGDQGLAADHGDACVSIIAACNNNYGVSGVSYNVTPKAISHPVQGGWVPAFNLADLWLLPGESYFIEIHALGPTPAGVNCNPSCTLCPPDPDSQWRYIAVEYWDDAFNAIQTHTANGIIVYEAAGNGSMNLDHAVYNNKFQRWFRDSGAIVCGAAVGTTRIGYCWSNAGTRLDLQGWGGNVYAAGYGGLFNPNMDIRQRYTSGFSGTSSATPIVTGAGNCLQGVSQDKYGITLSPAQIRSYMSLTGTDWEGTRDVGERPNLADAINYIEPDVQPWIRPGWTYSMVPRNAAGATGADCAITATLNGNSNTTYLNASGRNTGRSPAPDGGTDQIRGRIYLDNVYLTGWLWNPVDAGDYFYVNNAGPHTMRGGRHMTRWFIDPLDEFEEFNENNNWVYRQFVWSPLVLTNGAGINRDAPPLKNWGNPTFYSGEGFRATGTWWTGVAVMPQSGQDIDLYSYENSFTSTSGFAASQEVSGFGTGQTDFILINGNTLGFGQTRLFQTIRYLDGSTSDCAVEADESSTIASGFTQTQTLSAYEIMDIYEFNPGANNDFSVVVDNVTGDLDLAIALFQPGGDYYARGDAWQYVNNSGVNGAEYLYANPPAGGYMACVVFKPSGSTGYNNSGNYRIRYTTNPVPNVTTLPRPGWDAPVVLRNAADATSNNAVYPAQIQGNVTNYLSRTWSNNGTGATQSAFQVDVRIDGILEASVLNGGNLNPYAFTHSLNTNIGTVRGGRHTVLLTLDVNDDEAESNESDNTWSQQYVWSPLALAYNTALDRPAPPDRGTGTYPNSDGFSFTTPSAAAKVVAILSPSVTADHDLRLYSDYVGTSSGFSVLTGSSAFGPTVPDYVLIPWRLTLGGHTTYAAAVEFNDSPANYFIEGDHGDFRTYSGPTWNIPNPDSIMSGEILNVYEIYLTAGQEQTITCSVLSGNANVSLRLHRDSTTVSFRGQTVAAANANGNGEGEQLVYTPTVTDWYALVVEKANSASANESVIYNLGGTMVVPAAPAAPMNLVIQVTNSQSDPIWTYAAWQPVTTDVEGNPLTVESYRLFVTLDPNLDTFPAGWLGLGAISTTETPITVSPAITYFRMCVVAVDSNQTVLTHSPLPGGENLIGTTLPEVQTPAGTMPHVGPVFIGREQQGHTR